MYPLLLQNTKVFDRAALLDRLMDDEDLLSDVLRGFLSDTPGLITKLRKAVINDRQYQEN